MTPPAGADPALELDQVVADFRRMAAISAHGMTVGDLGGRLLVVNDAYARLVGRPAGELVGMSYLDFTHPADREVTTTATEGAVAAGAPGMAIDKRYVRPDGTLVDVRVSATVVRSRAGDPLCYVTQVTDLTALHAAEASAKRVVTSSADAYIAIDAVGLIREWNPAAVRMFGWARQTALGAPLADLLIPAAQRAAHHAGLDRYARTGETHVLGRPVDLIALRADGTTLAVEVTIWASEEAGRPVSYHAFLRDTSERRANALAAARHSLVFESISDAVFLTNAAGLIVETNPAGVELFGRPREQLLGVTSGSLLDADTDIRVAEVRAAALANGSWSGDVTFTRPDGERRTTEVVIRPVGIDTTEGFLAVHHDVTAARAATAALTEAEARYRLLADNSADIISQMSIDGTVLYVSPSYERTFGSPAARVVGGRIGSNAHPDDEPALREAFQTVVGGVPVRMVGRRRRADGSWMWLETNSEPLRDPRTGEVTGVLSAGRDITDRRAAELELERLALTDALTGLANRPLLHDRIRQAQHRLRRDPGHIALLMLDLDRFKLVNDSLGHGTGDALLVAVAARLQRCARPSDTVARLGGDEFVILLDRLTDPRQAGVVADRVLSALREPLQLPGLDPLAVRGSIGITATANADHPAEALFREADLALYRAKDFGRDRYALFDAGLRQTVVAQVEAERLARRGLADNLFQLHYQPIVRLHDQLVIGSEALIRLADPATGELVMPASFIGAAEESGFIGDIDNWVLTAAITALGSGAGPGVLSSVAVNVSPRSMLDHRFADRVAGTLADHGVSPDRLAIEVTERTLMDTTGSAIRSLERLRSLGVRVGVDDFGTGYSSLGYLQRLPLDFLKIDRSFTAQLGTSTRAAATVQAITTLAHAHNLSVIIEGVETHDQLEIIATLGCDDAQGYYLGRPAALDGTSPTPLTP